MNVPSYTNVYKKFDDAEGSCDDKSGAAGVIGTLKGKLTSYGHVAGYEESAVKNWCQTPKMEVGNLSNKEHRCNFLYFWIGKELCSATNQSDEFLKCMNDVYEQLDKISISNKCPNVNTDIDKNIFDNRKTVWDFSYNYKHIKDLLASHHNSCDETYYNHLQSAVTAFGDVLTDCQGKGKEKGSSYCSWFKNTFYLSSNNDQNPLTLTSRKTETIPVNSTSVTVHRNVQLELNFASKANTTATIVSSIFGVMGLPMTAFFLYKYNLLPSGIQNFFGNNSSGNRRNRRKGKSTTGRHHFDNTFTEGTSTYDSATNVSTVASTIADSTDTSTLYNDRSTSNRRRVNNKQQPQQRQHQGQQNSRNISYGRMQN
ncbi:KIR protein [Plasmodium coatneyi]|uniref:KIR protein n=1 Tax=Plasmodium coatneyi TaxID=208452 RepID=A0A1B1DVH4_9APIC|nr:KIR protein [Plasmodium coatneyi]ANQ06791.1 KIR protein [Plasmodium coatneyi]